MGIKHISVVHNFLQTSLRGFNFSKPLLLIQKFYIYKKTNCIMPTKIIILMLFFLASSIINIGCRNNHPRSYINSFNQEVQSPIHSNVIPKGACAICGDGSYSFSQHHSGTCSHHGGVAKWLK
ncbi:MAG: DUF3761 domain-containing protein [Saprospiraceae bacterium]